MNAENFKAVVDRAVQRTPLTRKEADAIVSLGVVGVMSSDTTLSWPDAMVAVSNARLEMNRHRALSASGFDDGAESLSYDRPPARTDVNDDPMIDLRARE